VNYELLTHKMATHRQDLQREAEQQRLLAHHPAQHTPTVRRAIAQCGVLLIRIGMKLKQVEMHGKPQTI
jgi:hypothetical protein